VSEHESHIDRVKKLLAQDPEINPDNLQEFRMNLEVNLQSWEARATRLRRRILIAVITYAASMVVVLLFGAARNSLREGALATVYHVWVGVGFVMNWLALVVGLWLVVTYFYRYAPALKRARFDMQNAMIGELQQQIEQLRQELKRRDA
jgi:hypothetical protein